MTSDKISFVKWNENAPWQLFIIKRLGEPTLVTRRKITERDEQQIMLRPFDSKDPTPGIGIKWSLSNDYGKHTARCRYGDDGDLKYFRFETGESREGGIDLADDELKTFLETGHLKKDWLDEQLIFNKEKGKMIVQRTFNGKVLDALQMLLYLDHDQLVRKLEINPQETADPFIADGQLDNSWRQKDAMRALGFIWDRPK